MILHNEGTENIVEQVDYKRLLSGTTVISVSEMIYEALKEAILVGKLECGQQLNERLIAKQLEISVTPVKEALRKLEMEGLTCIYPRKGTFVADRIMNTLEEIYMVRSSLESTAAHLASEKITDEEIRILKDHMKKMEAATKAGDIQLCSKLNAEFHKMIREISRNSYIIYQLRVVRSHEAVIQKQLLSEKDELERALEDHKEILQAIVSRDGEAAEQASRIHIKRTVAYIKSLNKRR